MPLFSTGTTPSSSGHSQAMIGRSWENGMICLIKSQLVWSAFRTAHLVHLRSVVVKVDWKDRAVYESGRLDSRLTSLLGWLVTHAPYIAYLTLRFFIPKPPPGSRKGFAERKEYWSTWASFARIELPDSALSSVFHRFCHLRFIDITRADLDLCYKAIIKYLNLQGSSPVGPD